MPITTDNYKNFYFGTSAEFQVMSEIFLLGYEASKLTPDVGFDVVVTNKAKQRFENKSPRCFYLQIKFSFEINNKVNFFINANEFDQLCNDDSAIAVFCYASPEIVYDHSSFDQRHIRSDVYWEQENQKSFDGHIYDSRWLPPYGDDLFKKHIKTGAIEIRRAATRYFWLNNKQLQRAKQERAFVYTKKGALLVMSLHTDPNYLPAIMVKNERETLCEELFDIRFALSGCNASKLFQAGNFLVAHDTII